MLRLGRANASTDHSSVLFDVDATTGKIKKGMHTSVIKLACFIFDCINCVYPMICCGKIGITNAHWYKLWTTSGTWLPGRDFDAHPDPPYPKVTGKTIPDMKAAVDVVTTSHFKLMADVPLVGWDVAFTETGTNHVLVSVFINNLFLSKIYRYSATGSEPIV